MKLRLLLVLLPLLCLIACQSQNSDSSTPQSPAAKTAAAQNMSGSPLLQTPQTPVTVELTSAALPHWRQFASRKPVLVLMSQDPFLMPPPAPLADRARDLVRHGRPDSIRQGGDPGRPDPLFFPQMSVRLALESGFFQKMVWVLPSNNDPEQLDIEIFRQQLATGGLLHQSELQSLELTDQGFSGTVADIPFLAVHPGKLPRLNDPVVLHLDLSFFQSLYRNEVKTPIFGLLQQTLTEIRATGWPALAITLSPGNQDGRVALDLRFLTTRLESLFAAPEMVDQAMPADWQKQDRALYLATFLKSNLALEGLTELVEEKPDDADYQYFLYKALRAKKRGDEALISLRTAVGIDPGYALEYLALAETATKKGLSGKALEMLNLAQTRLPQNFYLDLRRITALEAAGRRAEAAEILTGLMKFQWSENYYPDIPEKLRKALLAGSP